MTKHTLRCFALIHCEMWFLQGIRMLTERTPARFLSEHWGSASLEMFTKAEPIISESTTAELFGGVCF